MDHRTLTVHKFMTPSESVGAIVDAASAKMLVEKLFEVCEKREVWNIRKYLRCFECSFVEFFTRYTKSVMQYSSYKVTCKI